MKLFSRKTLVAGATALSMTFAGTTVATAAEPTTATESVEAKPASTPTETKPSEEPKEGSSIKDLDPNEIKAWIGVFTAVIGAPGTLFAFANKYLDLPFGTK